MDMYNDMLGTDSNSLTHERLPDQRMIGTCSAHVLRTHRRRRSCAVAAPPAYAYSALYRLKTPWAFVRRRLLAIHDHPRPAYSISHQTVGGQEPAPSLAVRTSEKLGGGGGDECGGCGEC